MAEAPEPARADDLIVVQAGCVAVEATVGLKVFVIVQGS